MTGRKYFHPLLNKVDQTKYVFFQDYAAKEVYIIIKSLGAAKERIWGLIEEKNIKTWISFDENVSNKKVNTIQGMSDSVWLVCRY